MFIGFDKESSQETIGFVADFCPFCCNLQSLRVFRFEQQLSFRFLLLPFWRKKTPGYAALCSQCKVMREVNPSRYEELSDQPLEPDALAKALTQQARSELDERCMLEERSKKGILSPEDRLKLIAEPLRALEPYFGGCLSDQSMSLRSIAVLVSALAAFMLSGEGFLRFPGLSRDGSLLLFLTCGIAATIFSLRRDVRDNSQRAIVPFLAPLYSSLKPERHELEQVIRQLRTENRKTGEQLSADRLYDDLLRASRG